MAAREGRMSAVSKMGLGERLRVYRIQIMVLPALEGALCIGFALSQNQVLILPDTNLLLVYDRCTEH